MLKLFKIKIMKVLVIDNYDSFTYNLVHMVEELTGESVIVARNNEISVEEVGHLIRLFFHQDREYLTRQATLRL